MSIEQPIYRKGDYLINARADAPFLWQLEEDWYRGVESVRATVFLTKKLRDYHEHEESVNLYNLESLVLANRIQVMKYFLLGEGEVSSA